MDDFQRAGEERDEHGRKMDQVEQWRKVKRLRLGFLITWFVIALIMSLSTSSLSPAAIIFVTLNSASNAFGIPTPPQLARAQSRTSGENALVRVFDIGFVGLLFGGLDLGVRERRLRRRYQSDSQFL